MTSYVEIEKGSETKPRLLIPSLIFEMKVKPDPDILAQTRYYVIDCFHQMRKRSRLILSCEFMITKRGSWLNEGTLSLKGFLSQGPNTRKLDQILIWEGRASAESMTMIIQALLKVAEHNILCPKLETSLLDNVLIRFLLFLIWFCFSYIFLEIRECSPFVLVSKDVPKMDEEKTYNFKDFEKLPKGNYVYKIFDYRSREVDENQRRKPDLFFKYLKDTRTVYEGKDICILVMPYLKGTHYPSRASDFLPIVEQIEDMHNNNHVHGDLRLFNIIFNGRYSQIIDYDYSGVNKKKCYPDGWVTEIPDGERDQREAQPGRPLKKEHDWVALVGMMKLFGEK